MHVEVSRAAHLDIAPPAGSRVAAVGDEGLCEHLERAAIAAASGKIAPAEAEQDDGDDDPDDAADAEW